MLNAVNNEREIWVFSEHARGKLRAVTEELLHEARELSAGAWIVCAVSVSANRDIIEQLATAGAERIYCADSPTFNDWAPVPCADFVIGLARKRNPEIILFGGTDIGRDIAPRVASALRTGLTANCSSLRLGRYIDNNGRQFDDVLLQIRPVIGRLSATIVTPESRPQMTTVREGALRRKNNVAKGRGEIVQVAIGNTSPALQCKVISDIPAEEKPNLVGAERIVAGGMGMGEAQGFKLLHELAEAIGGQVGATRPAVDAGFTDHSRQIGQTGLTVRPRLYIACGISGAAQHTTGMSESETIIAINSDPTAPIFEMADYKIIGDVRRVIPALISALRRKGT